MVCGVGQFWTNFVIFLWIYFLPEYIKFISILVFVT